MYFPEPKRGRVGETSRRHPVDDVEPGHAVRPSWPHANLYARRLLRHGTVALINPVKTEDLLDDYSHPHVLHRADHARYPNPHNYTVRVMDREDFDRFGCRCARGCTWDPVTRQAEVLCRCGNPSFDPGDYVGESTDNDKIYMADDLATKGLFGGNPYKC